MLHGIRNNIPSTYIVEFIKPQNGKRISLYDSAGRVYYYRDLPADCNKVKINITDPGYYTLSQPANIKRIPLQITRGISNIRLPYPERSRQKPVRIIHDPSNKDLQGSPAIIYTDKGLIVTGSKFKNMPLPMQRFIIGHEKGHLLYETEKYCDLYAFVNFVKDGGNPSTAIYCLIDMLSHKPQNDERIQFLYDQMCKAELIK